MNTTRRTAAMLLATSFGVSGIASAINDTAQLPARETRETKARAEQTTRIEPDSALRSAERPGTTRRLDAAPAEQSNTSIPMGRGQRIPIFLEKLDRE